MLERTGRDALRPPVDEAVLRRIDDASGTVDSPYADVETLARKVESVAGFLVGVARDRALTDYGTVASECGVHPSRLERVLVVLGVHEAANDRPLLPAVVTRADREIPGEAYFELVERAPDHADDVPADPETREWIWGTHRSAVYRQWGGRPGSGGNAASGRRGHASD